MYTCRNATFPVNRCKTDHKRIKRNQTSDVGWSEAVPSSWMRESEGELFFYDIYYFTRNREQVDLKRSGWLHNTSYQRSEMVWWSTGLFFHFLRGALWLHMHSIAKSITDKYCEKRVVAEFVVLGACYVTLKRMLIETAGVLRRSDVMTSWLCFIRAHLSDLQGGG